MAAENQLVKEKLLDSCFQEKIYNFAVLCEYM